VKDLPVKGKSIMKFLKFFKNKKTEALALEELSSENMIRRPGKYTNYGAQLKKDNIGNVIALEIWNVSPWPDDKTYKEFEIYPHQVTILKEFLKLFEKYVTYEDAHPEPISMLPVPRGVTLLDCRLRELEKLNKKMEEHRNRKKTFLEELFGR
jgi:hypothetical protein